MSGNIKHIEMAATAIRFMTVGVMAMLQQLIARHSHSRLSAASGCVRLRSRVLLQVLLAMRCKAPIRLCPGSLRRIGSRVCYPESRDEPLVVVQNGKYGYIDHDGKVVIGPQFIWADNFWRG